MCHWKPPSVLLNTQELHTKCRQHKDVLCGFLHIFRQDSDTKKNHHVCLYTQKSMNKNQSSPKVYTFRFSCWNCSCNGKEYLVQFSWLIPWAGQHSVHKMLGFWRCYLDCLLSDLLSVYVAVMTLLWAIGVWPQRHLLKSSPRNDFKLFSGYWLIWLYCIIGFLDLIIKAFDNQTEIWSWLSRPLIIKLFEMLDDNHDYFVYKTFTHKSNKPD